MSQLTTRYVQHKEFSLIYFTGAIDETTTLRWESFPVPHKRVIFNLKEVSAINSCGIREWIGFLSSIPSTIQFELIHCSIPFAQQLQFVANLVGHGILRSFYLPIVCSACDFDDELLVQRDTPTMCPHCARCGAAMEFDFFPQLPDAFPSQIDSATTAPQPEIEIDALRRVLLHVYETSSVAMALITSDGAIACHNTAFSTLYGMTRRHLVNSDTHDLPSFELSGHTLPFHALAFDINQTTTWREVRIANLSHRSFQVEVVPFERSRAALILINDLSLEASLHEKYKLLWQEAITSQEVISKKNKQLEAQNQTLTQTQHDLTQALTQLELAHASMLMTEKLSALGQISGSLAHELNNPASYVLTNLIELTETIPLVDNLAKTIDPTTPHESELRRFCGDFKTLVEDALEGARRIAQITTGLKQFIHQGKPVPTACDVNVVIESSLRLVENQLRHRCHVRCEFGEVPLIFVDEGLLSQALVNVLINAVQAFNETDNDALITISSFVESNQVGIRIHDTGRGMSDAVRKRAIEPFFTTKKRGEGTGLGLSLAHKIVVEHRGTLAIESQIGSGTTVIFRFPSMSDDDLNLQSHARTRRITPQQLVSLPSSLELQNKRVLLVDDDVRILYTLKRLVSRRNRVETAQSGEGALNLLEQDQNFDVLLIDLMMPGLSGVEVVAQIEHRYPQLAHKLVVMTGGGFTPEAQSFLTQSPYPMIKKPFEPTILFQTLSHIANR